jgi:hypothetical protein
MDHDTSHYNLIASALMGRDKRPDLAASGIEVGNDWDSIVETAADEQVLALMRDLVSERVLAEELPADVANLFETVKNLNSERNENILAQLREIAYILNERGIEPIVLKGAAHLLSGVYPNLSTRFLVDLDILLPADTFSTAIKLLKQHGYSCNGIHPVEEVIGNEYPPLWKAGSVEVDLHRDLGLGACKRILSTSEVLRDSTVHEFEGVRVRIPSPEHLVVHHIIHSQIHDYYPERIRPSLRTMYDMVLLQRRFSNQIDWPAIDNRFRCGRRYPAFAMYLKEVQRALGFASPMPIQMTGVMWIQWWRRTLLRKVPSLRFFDPLYLLITAVKPRTPVTEILSVPGGLKYLLAKPFTRSFYARRFAGVR